MRIGGRRRIVERHDLRRVDDLDLGAGVAGVLRRSVASSAALPTSRRRIPNSRAAATAPSTLTSGAWSPPIASTAIRTSALSAADARVRELYREGPAERESGEVSDGGRVSSDRARALRVDRLLALVVPAARAHAVRLLGLVAVRALRERRRRQRVVRAALVAAGLAVAPSWDWASCSYTFSLRALQGLPAGIDRCRARRRTLRDSGPCRTSGRARGSLACTAASSGCAICTRSSAIGASGDDRVRRSRGRRGLRCASSTSSDGRAARGYRARAKSPRPPAKGYGARQRLHSSSPPSRRARPRARIPPRCARPRPSVCEGRDRERGAPGRSPRRDTAARRRTARARRAPNRGRGSLWRHGH